MGVPDPVVPMALSESMRSTESLSVKEVIQFMVGLDVDFFPAKGDHADFILTYLMPPLTSVCGDEEAGAPATRARCRGASRAGRRADWPELPTTLTCWRYIEEAYQILIEPAAAGHELVGIRGPTLIPPMPMEPVGATAPAPVVPPPVAGRREEQISGRGRARARGTRDESGPSEPIPSDDDVEKSDSEEAASQHSESSERGDDDAGSKSGDGSSSDSSPDSNSDADGDNALESSPPRKMTKRASRG
ncbi:hypothetical protein CsSME_00001034 [Camellia sinensis var. sinensis]